jgi:hypothetical protein
MAGYVYYKAVENRVKIGMTQRSRKENTTSHNSFTPGNEIVYYRVYSALSTKQQIKNALDMDTDFTERSIDEVRQVFDLICMSKDESERDESERPAESERDKGIENEFQDEMKNERPEHKRPEHKRDDELDYKHIDGNEMGDSKNDSDSDDESDESERPANAGIESGTRKFSKQR